MSKSRCLRICYHIRSAKDAITSAARLRRRYIRFRSRPAKPLVVSRVVEEVLPMTAKNILFTLYSQNRFYGAEKTATPVRADCYGGTLMF